MVAKNVWAVIPAHNESAHIASVISQTKKFVSQVVVVNDGSTDDTKKVAEKTKAKVLTHIINLGKGAALKTGCDYAKKNGADVIIVLDADAQHDPKDIPRFLKALESNDLVFGYRKLNKNMPFILRFGNWFIAQLTTILYGITIPDTQCGFRAFTAKAYTKIRWKSTDYSMESEMIAKTGRHKIQYTTLPIKTVYASKYKGTTVFDGVSIVVNMIWWKLFQNGR